MNRSSMLVGLALTLVLGTNGCSKKGSPTAPPVTQSGAIYIETYPPGAFVSLDGSASGARTPATVPNVAAGSRQLGLHLLGYRDTTLTVAVSAAHAETLGVPLGPKPGTPSLTETWLVLAGTPQDVAIGPGDNVYFVTQGPNELHVNSPAGAQLVVTSLGLSSPTNVTVASNGDAFVAINHVVERYSSSGAYLGTLHYTSGGASWAGFPRPAIGPGDTLFIFDDFSGGAGTEQVSVFANGSLATVWNPDPAVDLAGLTVDPALHRCYLFSADSVHVYGTGGARAGGWFRETQATSIALGPDGSVYFGGEGAEGLQIVRFSSTGTRLAEWGVAGISVAGLAVDGTGRVYVAESAEGRIVRFVP